MSRTDLRNRLVLSLSKSINELSISNNGEQLKNKFICPICLKIFDLNECLNSGDKISLEDIPPKSLGGHPLTITCKNCNNSCGRNLDIYLFNEIKKGCIIPLSGKEMQKGTISNGSTTLQGQISFDVYNKIISVKIDEKNNNPSNIDTLNSDLKKAFESRIPANFQMNFTELKRCPEVLSTALLKNAYLLAFHTFGYRYILQSNLDIVRIQILFPQQKILSINPIIFLNERSLQNFDDGVYKVSIEDQLCIGVIFTLNMKEINIAYQIFAVLPDFNDKKSRIYSEVFGHGITKVSIIAKYKKINQYNET